jgi:inositol-phosphate phosphatase / L-galactose 1-phosphate phosphatase / histidinol-phosphatase
VLRRYHRSGVGSEAKPDESPVTVADREAEAAVRTLIEARFPDHGISGEEFGTVRGEAEWLWLIDPLDGTKSFLKGKPTFGVLIGLAHRGRHVLGVIDQPVVGDRWVGADGHGTRHNGRAVRCRPCARLADAAMAAVGVDAATEADEPRVRPLRQAVRHLQFGLECTAYGLVASGFLDLAIDALLGTDDIAALEPVVRNAGGVLTDLEGRAVDAAYAGRILAAGSPALHREALRVMDNR